MELANLSYYIRQWFLLNIITYCIWVKYLCENSIHFVNISIIVCVCVHLLSSLNSIVVVVILVFMIHFVVDMLWEHICHLLRQAVFILSNLCSFLQLSPIPTPFGGCRVYRRHSCWFLLWAEVFYDSLFGFQTKEPSFCLKSDSYLRIWWESQKGQNTTIFLSLSQKFRLHISLSSVAAFLWGCSLIPLFLSPSLLDFLLCSAIYTFKHEDCLIWGTYQYDNQNKSRCGHVAAWLE